MQVAQEQDLPYGGALVQGAFGRPLMVYHSINKRPTVWILSTVWNPLEQGSTCHRQTSSPCLTVHTECTHTATTHVVSRPSSS